MPSNERIKLAELLVARGLSTSVADAERAIRAGDVLGADTVFLQPNVLVDPACEIRVRQRGSYVSRGGDKLAGALADFRFDPQGLRCLDVGASTGGFTDCLLQHGAASVVAVDVAYGQFAWQLRNDERVTVIERTNIRSVDAARVGAPFDLVVADVSFTPVRSLLPLFASFMHEGASLITLIKPQFELASAEVGAGGVVFAAASHARALKLVVEAACASDLAPQMATSSPLKGPKGNIEFFLLAQRAGIPVTIDIQNVAERAHARLD
ncbi:MAG: TlyA family RNA methyltransferase [Coriobacteriales bacterium]|jgi:23S rRNA (cytidine1920-2'-O)/16S rRNA (cytidine1409-2'-O)-methyltransferase|nr:TlyA family RNA methyltransferase [Coriobacteriales bacterium]